MDRPTYVYFISNGEAIKIGCSVDALQRKNNLQVGNHTELKFIGAIPETIHDEDFVQQKFAHLRIRGEWYTPAPELLEFIQEHDMAPMVAATEAARLDLLKWGEQRGVATLRFCQRIGEKLQALAGDPNNVDLRQSTMCEIRALETAIAPPPPMPAPKPRGPLTGAARAALNAHQPSVH